MLIHLFIWAFRHFIAYCEKFKLCSDNRSKVIKAEKELFKANLEMCQQKVNDFFWHWKVQIT